MNYIEWKKEIAKNYKTIYQKKLKQFGIATLDNDDEFTKELIINNIFGATKIEPIIESYQYNTPLNIVVGFGGNGKIHLGHLTTINEILFYLQKFSSIKIWFVNFDIEYKSNFIEKSIEILKNNYSKKINYEIIDYKNFEILKLKKIIAQNININEINRLMGWKNHNFYDYEKVLNMLITFFVKDFWNENTVVISDINQVTFYGLAKILEKKLKISLPTITYHTLVPSLKSDSERMSIKKEKSTIFLDEEKESILRKLYGTYTGTINKIDTCSYLKVLDFFYKYDFMEDRINNYCLCDKKCDYCKKCSIEKLTDKIITKKLRSSEK